MVFNANDPSGAGGLSADLTAMSSASAHVLAVVTGTYVRDTTEIHDHFAFDEEAVTDQARCALEDMPVQAFKVGFVGSAENLSAIASHRHRLHRDSGHHLHARPVLVGRGRDRHLPRRLRRADAAADHGAGGQPQHAVPLAAARLGRRQTTTAREVARAAAVHGVPYTLVTGFNAADQYLESHLASPESVLATARYERFEATFSGAGDTLSAALCALIANGMDLQAACAEALTYLDQCLDAGFQPGMGHAVPDRLFWAHDDEDEVDTESGSESTLETRRLPAGHHQTLTLHTPSHGNHPVAGSQSGATQEP